jgi:hypothetical protein
MKIGYARVSTLDQNPDLQGDALQKQNVKRSLLIRSAALLPKGLAWKKSKSFCAKEIRLWSGGSIGWAAPYVI